MPEVATSELKQAVESQHGGTAKFAKVVPVHETHEGETVWDGVVHVFDLAGHPTAKRAYAWSHEPSDGRRSLFAVLQAGPVRSAADAVRAAIASLCMACGGAGEINEAVDEDGSFDTPGPVPCAECGGTGRRR